MPIVINSPWRARAPRGAPFRRKLFIAHQVIGVE